MKTIASIFTVLFIFLNIPLLAQGYKIKVKLKDTSLAEYALCGWEWGRKYGIDTIYSNSSKIIFLGKTNLPDGIYSIEKINKTVSNNLIEFIIPKKNKNFKATFLIDSLPPYNKVVCGNKENKLFFEFQNLAKYKLPINIDSLRRIGEKTVPNGLINYILNNNPPLNNSIIINTHFAPKFMEQYLKQIELNRNDTIINKINNLINSANSNKLKLFLASSAFNYFSNSNIMGQEEIAVKIAQQWIINKDFNIANNQDLFYVKTFVEFNKNSLIGMDAPNLELTDTLGNKVSLNDLSGEYNIIYFYNNSCNACKIETPQLINFIDEYNKDIINVLAVYTNNNIKEWKDYINKEFNTYNPFTTWINAYDPDFNSGFELLYNVIKTPQIYLLDNEHKIIGRGLNVKALKELITLKDKEKDDLQLFFNNFFTPLTNDTTAIYNAINLFYEKSINSKKLFNEIFKELYNFLRQNNNYSFQEGSIYLAQNYIISKPQLWDSLFVNKVTEAVKIFNKNKLGTKANNLTLELPDKSSQTLYNSKSLYKVLYFYRPNCGTCSLVTPQLAKIYNNYKNKLDIDFYAINLGSNYQEWIKYILNINANFINLRGLDGNPSDIYNNYYLSNIPAIYLLKDNIVIAKDINDIDLETLLESLL